MTAVEEPTSISEASSIRGIVLAVVFVSAGVLGFEIALMRLLLVASWHHFAFLVISIGLLGFGLSGTVLMMERCWLAARSRSAMPMLVLATSLAMPLCAGIAQHVPVEARIVPLFLWRQIGLWLLYWSLLTIPFLLGATTIGLALVLAGPRVATAYAANLLGSSLGAVLITAAMWIVPPPWLPLLAGAITLPGAGGALAGGPNAWRHRAALGLVVAVAALWVWRDPPQIRPDPYKFSSHVQRLAEQGDARRIACGLSPRGVIEVFRGSAFHELPFLSLGATPPAMDALVMDGHSLGGILRSQSLAQSRVVEQAMMAVPYELLGSDRPEVLLLGEKTGSNCCLAALKNASRIDSVQSDPLVVELMQEADPALLNLPGARWIAADPRHFVERRGPSHDLVQLVSLEGSAAGSNGIAGLGQDYLVTVEGLEACLRRLKPQGMLSFCRGIQSPPRDNLKLFAAVAEALRRRGISQPGRHVVIVRDFLAVCTMVRVEPWSPAQIARVRTVCEARQLTPVWYDGIRADELNRPDAMPGPPGGAGDWYHHAAVELFTSDGQKLIEQWLFDIRPPTDDRPFFLDFCRLRAIGPLRQAFGDLWLTRAEAAYLFVLAAIGIILIIAVAVGIAPLLLWQRIRRAGGKWTSAAYFAAIGLAYLLLEMTLLSRLTQLIGDPVLSSAVTIASFLLGSGLGSMLVQRTGPELRAVVLGTGGIIVLSIAVFSALGPLTRICASIPDPGRIAAAVSLILPPAVLMGIPMPAGLRRLDRGRADLLPWAWGVNGFASVLAAPIGMALAMTWGFSAAALSSVLLYAAAAALYTRLPG